MTLIETFRHHSQVLSAKSSALEVIHHDGDRGAEREDLLSELLTPLLPEKIGIGRGEIMATNGNWSKQEDLILYDKLNCPRLFVGSRSQIFPIESVATIIEVKTSLGTKEIQDATKNISEAKMLSKSGMSTHISSGSIGFGPPTPVLGCLFAYRLNLKPETFYQKWIESQLSIPPEQRINLVCILNECTIVFVDKIFYLWDNLSADLMNSITFFESKEDSLLTFFLNLSRVLAEYHFGTPDLFKYVFSNNQSLTFQMKWFKNKDGK
ncbi:MAG: DUF6602 domain-containing protein [Anaerolineales bacterium]